MATYLIVANRTLPSQTLASALAERAADRDARFHVVVPATPIGAGLTWDEEASRAAAQERLDAVLARLHDLGATEASGEVGVPDPVAAVEDALRHRSADEIVLSTLPPGISRWLGQDVPTRLRSCVAVPVTVVTAATGSGGR
ncbi:MAG: hypothetical protein ACJ77N_12275 [Chloroflexota bacterium]|jgi:hypothetical protein